MSKRIPGLYKRGTQGIWHIDKCVRGYGRLHESTGTSELAEAERYLIRRLEEMRKASVYGIRVERSFRQAATKFLLDYQHKRSIGRYAQSLKILDPHIGDLPLRRVHQGTLEAFIRHRRKQGMQTCTQALWRAAHSMSPRTLFPDPPHQFTLYAFIYCLWMASTSIATTAHPIFNA